MAILHRYLAVAVGTGTLVTRTQGQRGTLLFLCKGVYHDAGTSMAGAAGGLGIAIQLG